MDSIQGPNLTPLVSHCSSCADGGIRDLGIGEQDPFLPEQYQKFSFREPKQSFS